MVSFKYDNGTGDNLGDIEWLKANPTIGIYENLSMREVSIYPNPNSGEFTVRYKAKNSSASVSVYDNMGRLVILEPIKEQVDLSLDDKSAGIYLIRIEDGMNISTTKVLVK